MGKRADAMYQAHLDMGATPEEAQYMVSHSTTGAFSYLGDAIEELGHEVWEHRRELYPYAPLTLGTILTIWAFDAQNPVLLIPAVSLLALALSMVNDHGSW